MFGSLTFILCVLVGIILILFLAYTALIYREHNKYAHIPGPPLSNFYLGNIPDIRAVVKKNKSRNILFLEWAEQYGPLYKVFMFHKCMLVPTSRLMIKEFLTKSKYPKSKQMYSRFYKVAGERFLGTGLATDTEHQRWKPRRSKLNPAFHKKYLITLMEQFNQIADSWIEQMQLTADGETSIKMTDFLGSLTLDAIGKIAFGIDFNCIQDKGSAFLTAFNTVQEAYSAELEDPFLRLKWSKRPFLKKAGEAARYVRQVARTAMEDRQKALSSGQYAPTNVITLLLECLEENKELTLEDILDDFSTLIVAGQETTSNALGFLLQEVGRRPEVYQKLQSEVDEVIGDKHTVTFNDLDKLHYMSNVVTETLRMYPVGPGTTREVTTDTQVETYHIPKGSFIMLSFFVMHRLAKYFPEPLDFNPDRWEDDKNRALFTYLPFAQGQRSCLGKYFAQIEMKIVLSKIFQRFNYTLDPDQSFDMLETSTLRPKGGVVLTLESR